jgi:zinc-finger of a C2HC-type
MCYLYIARPDVESVQTVNSVRSSLQLLKTKARIRKATQNGISTQEFIPNPSDNMNTTSTNSKEKTSFSTSSFLGRLSDSNENIDDDVESDGIQSNMEHNQLDDRRRSSKGNYPALDDYGESAVAQNNNFLECPDCGRRFNQDSLAKHAKICAKVFMNKRKPFDSKKQRLIPEAKEIIKPKGKSGSSSNNSAKKGATIEHVQTQDVPKWFVISLGFNIEFRIIITNSVHNV